MSGLRYSDVYTFVTEGLAGLGYGKPAGPTMPLLDMGPATVAQLQKKSPGPMLFLTVGNGVGLTVEGLYDRPFITVRAIGAQNDYAYAEQLAYDVDNLLLGVTGNALIGECEVLYVNRTGGAPQLVDFDSGDRYHFQATYITEAQR